MAILRLIHGIYILTRYGVIAQLLETIADCPPFLRYGAKFFTKRKAIKDDELIAAIAKLGPSYIKLAQFLATRPDIVGLEMSAKLSLMQDRLEPFSKQEAIKQIASSLNMSIEEVLDQFSFLSQAIAAASIAQVHQAIWVDADNISHKLALKVTRPKIKEKFAKDLKSFYRFAKLAEKFSSKARRLRFVLVVQELEHITNKEMDMRLEAAAISEMDQNTKTDKNFQVPKICWKLTGRECLAMQWIEAVKINDKAAIKQLGCDFKVLAQNLMQNFLRHALRDGYFHADMHPGNLFVDKNNNIIAVDFGIMGRLNKRERFFLAQILYGFLHRDYILVSQAHFDAGYVPKHHKIEDFAQATRAIGDPIHGQKAKDISMARLLTLLFEITAIFDMQTRPELILLQKNMVIVEGVARDLDPDFNMWQAAKPIVEEWMNNHIGFKNLASELQKAGKPILNILYSAPEILTQWLEERVNTSKPNLLHTIPQTINDIKKYIILTQISLAALALSVIYILFHGK